MLLMISPCRVLSNTGTYIRVHISTHSVAHYRTQKFKKMKIVPPMENTKIHVLITDNSYANGKKANQRPIVQGIITHVKEVHVQQSLSVETTIPIGHISKFMNIQLTAQMHFYGSFPFNFLRYLHFCSLNSLFTRSRIALIAEEAIKQL